MIQRITIEDVTSSNYYPEFKAWIKRICVGYQFTITSSEEYKMLQDALNVYYAIKEEEDFLSIPLEYRKIMGGYRLKKGYPFWGMLLYILKLDRKNNRRNYVMKTLLMEKLPFDKYQELFHILRNIEPFPKQRNSAFKIKEFNAQLDLFRPDKFNVIEPTCELPEFFNGKLRNSEAATKQFMELLRKCCKSIGKRNGKTWGHVREALINIGLIDTYSPKMTLAQTIAEICSNTTKSSVNQSMKRYYGKRDSVTDANIIADIAKQFQPVLDAIKP